MTVVGQITEQHWINIGIRWSGRNATDDNDAGLELYINKVKVAVATLPTKQRDGTFDFEEMTSSQCLIDKGPPPVITLGCTYNRYLFIRFFFFSPT